MIIDDHLYLPGMAGFNPLVGPNEHKFGTRFPAMGDAYDHEWRALFARVGQECGIELRRGVYTCVFGPNFESPAEGMVGRTTQIVKVKLYSQLFYRSFCLLSVRLTSKNEFA